MGGNDSPEATQFLLRGASDKLDPSSFIVKRSFSVLSTVPRWPGHHRENFNFGSRGWLVWSRQPSSDLLCLPLPSPFLFTSQLSSPLFFLSAIVFLALGDSPTTFLPSFFLSYTRTRSFADSLPSLDSRDHFTPPPLSNSNDQYKSTVLILATVDRVSSNKPRLASLFSSDSLPASDKISSCLFSRSRASWPL